MSEIDIRLLREKIAREVEQWKEKTANHYTIEAEARWSEANYILGVFDSLRQEQLEVDLGADIEMEWDSFNKHLAEYVKESEEVVWLNWNSFNDIARYFYGLGQLNSK